jgi:hypothetical protein
MIMGDGPVQERIVGFSKSCSDVCDHKRVSLA